MKFGWNPEKSQVNETKHGISFDAAVALFSDPNAILSVPANVVHGEERWVAVGKIESQVWTAVYTHRADTIWIISVRRAREEEREAYEG